MGRNTGSELRIGSVKNREQTYDTSSKRWTKYDATTGESIATKKSAGKWKGVAKADDGRRK